MQRMEERKGEQAHATQNEHSYNMNHINWNKEE